MSDKLMIEDAPGDAPGDAAAIDDAVDAAREQLQREDAEPPARKAGRPALPPGVAAARKRLADRNRKRVAKGEPLVGEGDADYDFLRDAGQLPDAYATQPSRSPDRPMPGDPAPQRIARERSTTRRARSEIEQENEQLRAELQHSQQQAAALADEQLAGAIGETFGTVWGVALAFAPNRSDPRAQLPDDARSELGKAWAPVLAPYLESVAGYVPAIGAAMITYRVFSERARIAWQKPQEVTTPDAPPVVERDDAGEIVRPMGVARRTADYDAAPTAAAQGDV